MKEYPSIFDTGLLRRRQHRAAARLGEHDFLLRRVAEDFFERLSMINRSFGVAVSIGLGANVIAETLKACANIGKVITAGTFVPEGVTAESIVAEEEALPFADGCLDLVVSGLSLHNLNDVPGALIQFRRALKPDGLLLASLLGGGTLRELRTAWLVAEEEVSGGTSPRVSPFADVRDLGGLLQRAGFALPVADCDLVRVVYSSPLHLMRDLKDMGASNALVDRRRVPVTRGLLYRAAEVYSERFALPDGRVPATFEIITLTAWAPHESQQKALKPGSAGIRLADALGVQEYSADEIAQKS